MTCYAVVTSIDNRGRISANIVDRKEFDQVPKSSMISTARKDFWTDWFGDLESARYFVQQARKA